MKRTIGVLLFFSGVLYFTMIYSAPSRNGDTAGCNNPGCHSHSPGDVSATVLNESEIEVTVTGVDNGEKVAGELIDGSGTVVSVVNSTNNNPFILTATGPGTYSVNAGYKSPDKNWDSTSVEVIVSHINGSSPAVVPDQMNLFQNHPNPFNNQTLIRFSLPKAASAEILIYNANGQIIKHLAKDNFSAGIHSLRWNGLNDNGNTVSTGVYIYKLISNEQVISKRLTLIK